LSVKPLGGSIDVVCTPALLPSLPPPSAVIVGSFFLSARLTGADVRHEEKAGSFAMRYSSMSEVRERYEQYVRSPLFQEQVLSALSLPRAKMAAAVILALTVIGLPAALWILYQARRRRRLSVQARLSTDLALARVARPVPCYGLMLPAALRSGIRQHAPALVVGTFDHAAESEMPGLVRRLRELAQELPSTPEGRFVQEILADSRYDEDRRRMVPRSMCAGGPAYVFDVMLWRSGLPETLDDSPLIPCMATEGRRGKIRQIPVQLVQSANQART